MKACKPALKPSQVNGFREKFKHAELYNLYGPTEAAIDVTCWKVEGENIQTVPIGKPVANTKIYILDKTGKQQPIGIPGEIVIGGVQVARGYHNKPELTKEKFINDPYSTNPNQRLYKTGDLGRWTQDGNIEYLGRIDEQVKIRGYRIELGEIEQALMGVGFVSEAVVLLGELRTGQKALFAYIKLNEDLFSAQDLNGLYRTAINFCVKKLNQNNKYYTQKTFELYMYTIEKGILVENKEINRFVFTNTVTLGIKLEELKRLESFIEKYSGFIHEDYKQNTIDYNTAKILYARNQHDEALKVLLTNEFKDTIWNLNAKFIIAKIYFEIRDIKSFQLYLKSFKIYIKRKSNIGYHKTYFTNVTDALTKLLDIYKKPEKYKDFTFDSTTPDIDWFNKMLEATKTKKAPK